MKLSLRILVAITCLLPFASMAQDMFNPVSWDFTAEATEQPNEYILNFNADIDEGWVIYSQYLESDDGPIATEFNYESKGFEPIGQNEEIGTLKTEYDAIFDMELKKLVGKVNFKQKIKTDGTVKAVTGYLVFMCCDKERCLPPTDVEFSIDLP